MPRFSLSLLPLWGTIPDKMAPTLFAGFQVRAVAGDELSTNDERTESRGTQAKDLVSPTRHRCKYPRETVKCREGNRGPLEVSGMLPAMPIIAADIHFGAWQE